MNPAPHYGKPNKDIPDGDSDTPITKTVRKESIRWFVPVFWAVIAAGLLALARAEVSGMLKDYETEAEAKRQQDALQYQLNEQRSEYLKDHDDESKKLDELSHVVDGLSHVVNGLDKKMDRVQFTLEWNQQHQARNGTPKDQSNP